MLSTNENNSKNIRNGSYCEKMKTYYGRHRFSLCQSWSTSEETRKEAQGKVVYKFMIKLRLQNST